MSGYRPGYVGHPPPRVPAVTEMTEALSLRCRAVDADRLWVNPDCGLKTRGYAGTEAGLRNLVMAARRARVTAAR